MCLCDMAHARACLPVCVLAGKSPAPSVALDPFHLTLFSPSPPAPSSSTRSNTSSAAATIAIDRVSSRIFSSALKTSCLAARWGRGVGSGRGSSEREGERGEQGGEQGGERTCSTRCEKKALVVKKSTRCDKREIQVKVGEGRGGKRKIRG